MEEPPPIEDDHVLRFFPDYGADSPLWWDGLEDPADFGIPEDLCRRLESWADTFNEFADYQSSSGWREKFDATAFERMGDEMARQVADMLGSGWAVDRIDVGKSQTRRIRSSGAATRREVAEKAEARAKMSRDLLARIEDDRQRGILWDITQSIVHDSSVPDGPEN